MQCIGIPMATLGALVALSTPALAQYPNKPITVIVPFAAGGPTDVVARVVGEHMGRTLAPSSWSRISVAPAAVSA